MKKKLTALFILVICMGLTGCGNSESEDTMGVSADVELVDFPEESTVNTTLADASNEENESTATDNESDTNEETDSANLTNEDVSEVEEETEEISLPSYEVTPLEESVVMYSSTALNVRKGPSTDYEVVGSLKRGQDVTITGLADTGWYEILYKEGQAFASNQYLQEEKPEEEPVPEPALEANADPAQETPPVQDPPTAEDSLPQETAEVKPVTEVKNVAGVILVGDSRFVQMQGSVGENSCTWIAEGGKGYNWFNEKAVARIDSCVGKGSKILINLGVNDPGNIQNYLALVNAKAEEWVGKGARVYYASVNPVWENPYVTEEQVENFNSQMRNGLSGNVHWIDSHSYLNSIGYKLVDGLHYSTETYQNLYAYYMSCL